MTDLHVRALANSREQLERGDGYASIDHLSPAGEAAMRPLRARYNVRIGAVYLRSDEATQFAGAAHAVGLLVRYN